MPSANLAQVGIPMSSFAVADEKLLIGAIELCCMVWRNSGSLVIVLACGISGVALTLGSCEGW